MKSLIRFRQVIKVCSVLLLFNGAIAQSYPPSSTQFPYNGQFKASAEQPDLEYGYGQTIFDQDSEISAWDAAKSRAGFYQELKRRYSFLKFREGKETSHNEYVYLCDGTIQFSYVAPFGMHILQIHGKNNNFLVVVGLEKGGPAHAAGVKVWDQILSVNKMPFKNAADGSYDSDEGVFKEFAGYVDKAQAMGGAVLEIRRYIEPKFRMDERSYSKIESAVLPQSESDMARPYVERIRNFPPKIREQLNMESGQFYKLGMIPVKLKKMPPFSKYFPFRCQKSNYYKKIVVDELIEAAETGRLSNGNSVGVAGLALLAHADSSPAAIEALEGYVLKSIADQSDRENFLQGKTDYIAKSEIGGSWGNGMRLIFLCEYFHATQDMRIFPILQKLALDASFRHLNPFGGGGHGIGGRGSYYDYSFGAPSALNTLAAALSLKVGAKVNDQMWQKYYNCYTNRIDRVIHDANSSGRLVNAKDTKYNFKYNPRKFYGAHYMARMNEGNKPGFWEQGFTSATAGLALYHIPKTEFSKELGDNIINHVKMMPFQHAYIHASPLLGLFWCHMAAAMPEYLKDKKGRMKPVPNPMNKGIRASLENRKAQILFTTTENNRYFYPYPKRTRFSDMGGGAVGGGWGGDGYLNMKGMTLSNTALFLAADKRVFLMHDNMRPGYLVPKGKDVSNVPRQIAAYHAFYLQERLKDLSGKPLEDPEAVSQVYREAKFLLDNYRGIAGYDKVKGFIGALYKKFGREKVEQIAVKFDCIDHVHYVLKGHERANRKGEDGTPGPIQNNRKKWLLYVASKFNYHPIAKEIEKLANRPDITTLDVNAELNQLIGKNKYSSEGSVHDQ